MFDHKVIKDIVYSGVDEKMCRLDLYLPMNKTEFKTLVFFHGGGLTSGDKVDNADAFEYLAKCGIAVVTANYRMYPNAKYPEFIEDAAEAVSWVYKNISSYGNSSQIYIAGSSAGAYLAMMLCLDKKYLRRHGIDSDEIGGYIFDSAQPTVHFNVLHERKLDTRKVIIDEAAPIYHIRENKNSPPILILVSDNDIPNRWEQTMLFQSTWKHFNSEDSKLNVRIMEGYAHTEYCHALDSSGNNLYAGILKEFIINSDGP